jgi:hypothetical protein
MNYPKIFRRGLYLSFLILLVSSAILVRPLLETTRFWLGAGFAVGIVGTFFFTVALASIDPDDYYDEEE